MKRVFAGIIFLLVVAGCSKKLPSTCNDALTRSKETCEQANQTSDPEEARIRNGLCVQSKTLRDEMQLMVDSKDASEADQKCKAYDAAVGDEIDKIRQIKFRLEMGPKFGLPPK